MGGTWNKECLDTILVPLGLVIMVGYHFWLLLRHISYKNRVSNPKQQSKKYPLPKWFTSMSHDHFYRGLWAERVMQVQLKDRDKALTVIGNNVTASFTLSTVSMTVSALIGTWFGSTSIPNTLIYGNTSQSILALKHAGLLVCLLVAFAAFLQSARCFVHSTYLLTMPCTAVKPDHVKAAVEHGSECWSVGMHALYFATPLLMWVFGPIPMFVSSVVMVVVLYTLEWNSKSLDAYKLLPPDLSEKTGGDGNATAGTPNGDGMGAASTMANFVAVEAQNIAQGHHV